MIQCCICKSNNQDQKWVEFFNVKGNSACGCTNCRNYANNANPKEFINAKNLKSKKKNDTK